MTIGEKMHQTLVQCETVAANLKSFALETQNKQAQQLYSTLARTMEDQIITPLRARVNATEQEEPQYRVFQQAQKAGRQGR